MRALLCLLLTAVLLAGCSATPTTTTSSTPAGSTPASSTPPQSSTTVVSSTPQTTGPQRTLAVSMSGNQFDPDEIIVTKGSTVTWTNDDDTGHTVSFVDNSSDSGLITPGQTTAHEFKAVGTFAYYCKYHSQMKGSVTVEASTVTSTPPVVTTPPAPVRFNVTIGDRFYSPDNFEIPNGSTVNWTNEGSLPHTVSSTAGFGSNALNFGQSYEHTFTRTGTFFYQCTFHSDMHGRLTVT
jgi:plastocyanin